MKDFFKTPGFKLGLKIFLTVIVSAAAVFCGILIWLVLALSSAWVITCLMGPVILPLVIPLIWIKKKKVYLLSYVAFCTCFVILLCTQQGINAYRRSITIDTAPAIDTRLYLPFEDDSLIVDIKSQTLSFEGMEKEELPIVDGAAAVFPVYSAFVNATYPDTTKLYDGVFQYNNTVNGYVYLAEGKTDIFFGAAPSKEQREYAESLGKTFVCTPIGYEAFVFFVNVNNPVDGLTTNQIKGIYSGVITRWSEVGGKNRKIVPYQRNKGSGSQSMLERFMGNTPILEPTTETFGGGMGGILTRVASYKNKNTSIGFSFRYYVEGIIKNPDIKMIAVDGVAPTKENIRAGTYPIIAPLYAVTLEDNNKPAVKELLSWVLSSEGQYIVEETGYVTLNG